MTTLEDISIFIYKSIETQKTNLSELKKNASEEYDCILSTLDISFIEQKYSEIVLQLWTRQCEESIKIKLFELKDSSELITLLSEFHQISNFDNLPKFLKTNFYDLIEEDRKYFNDDDLMVACNELLIFLTSEIKIIQKDVKIEFEFLELLISVFRESFLLFKRLLIDLNLKDFANRKLSLNEVVNSIISKNFDIKYYVELQILSQKLLRNDSLLLEEFIRAEVLSFTKTVEVEEVNESDKKIWKFTKKIMFMEDLKKIFTSDSQYDEIQIIADVLHITDLFHSQSHMVYEWKGINLFIIANTIRVHNVVCFDLCGKDGKVEDLPNDAGQNSNGRGRDGQDGYAGESGGNCRIECSRIVNPQLLHIKVIGGSGSNGQNGGDGSDGVDGRNAEESDFKINGIRFQMQWGGCERVHVLKEVGAYDPSVSKYALVSNGGCFEDDGLSKHVYVHCKLLFDISGLMLVKGANGSPGQSGGMPGIGGEGGYGGEIHIKTSDDSNLQVKANTHDGRSGKNGIAGYNGLNGKDGRDAWYFDRSHWSSGKDGGCNSTQKYEIEFSSSSRSISVWNVSRKKYAYPKLVCDVKAVDTNRCRNESTNTKSRASHSVAKKKSAISIESSSSRQYANYLQGSIDRVKNEKSKYDGISLNLEVGNISTKVSVKMTYQVTHEKMSGKKFDELSVIRFTFEDVKKVLENKISFVEFSRMLRRVDLNTEECIELKEIIQISDCFPVDDDEFFDAQIDNFERIRESQPFFIYYNLINDFDVNDAVGLLNEKLELKMFADFTERKLAEFFQNKLVKAKRSIELPSIKSKNLPIELPTPNEIENLIFYLEETKSLHLNFEIQAIDPKTNSETFQDYFNKDSSSHRQQIKSFYLKLKEVSMKLFDHSSKTKMLMDQANKLRKKDTQEEVETAAKNAHFFMSIIELLFRYKSEISNLHEEMLQFENVYRSVEQTHTNEQHDIESQKKVQIFIKKFFDNETIAAFVEDNLLDDGVTSPIYRRLIAFAFQVNVIIFIKRIDGGLALIENDNSYVAGSVVEAVGDGSNKSKELKQKVFLLMKENTFTTLQFNREAYERDEKRKVLANVMQLWTLEWNTFGLIGKEYSFKNVLSADKDENIEEFIRILLTYFVISTVSTPTEIGELESILRDVNYNSGS